MADPAPGKAELNKGDWIVAAHLQSDAVETAKIKDDAVTTAKILDANVTTAKIKDANVTTAKIAADAVTGAKIADDAIDSEHYTDGSIDTAHLADDAVTAAKADQFLSSEITSTAAAKAEAHGLGASPSVFFAILQETGASTNPNLSATADATNVYVTAASTDVKYIIFAWL